MKIPYTLKALVWQFLIVGVIIASLTMIHRSAWAQAAAFTAGLLFALRARLPEGLGRRFLPALVIPVVLCLCWGVALNLTQGNYSEDGWTWARFWAYPGWFAAYKAVDAGRFLAEFLPESTALPFYEWIDAVWHGVQYDVGNIAFLDASGLLYALSLHGAYLAGFAGPALLRAPGRRFDRPAIVLLLCCAAAGGYLYWELDRRERLLVPARETLSEDLRRETIFSEDGEYDDFDPFHVNEPWSKVARPDTAPSLRITRDFPRMDGATAFLPVMSAVFQAVYETPPYVSDGKKERADTFDVRAQFILEHFQLSTSREAYRHLIQGEVDLLIAFGPSEAQEAEAENAGVRFTLTPIGKEAFVFFVHEKNPVDELSMKEIRDIYSGKIGNWKQVGGADAPILAYQRPENSGSRTAMDRMVMRRTPQARPLREEMEVPMEGVVTAVADYRNEEPALGYSFRWFVMTMFPRPELKLLKVDGVAPTVGHITDGSYPLIRTFYAVTRQNDATPETKALVDWLVGPEGQALIAKTGYVPLR